MEKNDDIQFITNIREKIEEVERLTDYINDVGALVEAIDGYQMLSIKDPDREIKNDDEDAQDVDIYGEADLKLLKATFKKIQTNNQKKLEKLIKEVRELK